MWAWLIQRAAAVALLVVVAVHLVNPFRRGVQAALLLLVLVHALLGVRAVLLDFGLPVRWHGALFVLALVLSAGGFAPPWAGRGGLAKLRGGARAAPPAPPTRRAR